MLSGFSSLSDKSSRDIRERLLHIQRQSGLNQQQLAVYLNIGQPAVSKYLRGRIPPSEVLFKFARLGQTTMEWIICGEKSYFFEERGRVSEPDSSYGAVDDEDIALARRIARLPVKPRQLLLELIDIMENQKT